MPKNRNGFEFKKRFLAARPISRNKISVKENTIPPHKRMIAVPKYSIIIYLIIYFIIPVLSASIWSRFDQFQISSERPAVIMQQQTFTTPEVEEIESKL